jgi:hypothetical protein
VTLAARRSTDNIVEAPVAETETDQLA